MKLPLFVVFSISLQMFGPQAKACSFDDEVTGSCPTTISEASLITVSKEAERASLVAKVAWGNYKDFKEVSKDRPFSVKVCFFVLPTQNLSMNSFSSSDYSQVRAKWERKIEKVEKGFSKWTNIKGKSAATGAPIVSRVGFSTRTQDGEPRECEKVAKTSHILVAFHPHPQNNSLLGFESIDKLNRASNSPKASMWLRDSLNEATVVHEIGHSLGFLHEMGHSEWSTCAAAFDVENYVDNAGVTFGQPTREDEVRVAKFNVVGLGERYQNYVKKQTPAFDSDSIMAYRIADKFFDDTKTGGLKCGFDRRATRISKGDKQVFLQVYGMRE